MHNKPIYGQFSKSLAARIIITLAGLALCGCNGSSAELAKVRGRVEYDGKPLPKFDHAAVVLTPTGGRLAKGVIASDGTFQLTTYKDGDGAVVGTAKVSVSATIDDPSEKSEKHEGSKWVIPHKLGNADTSGLTCEVLPDQENVLRIVIRSDGSGTVERE